MGLPLLSLIEWCEATGGAHVVWSFGCSLSLLTRSHLLLTCSHSLHVSRISISRQKICDQYCFFNDSIFRPVPVPQKHMRDVDVTSMQILYHQHTTFFNDLILNPELMWKGLKSIFRLLLALLQHHFISASHPQVSLFHSTHLSRLGTPMASTATTVSNCHLSLVQLSS